MIRQTVAPPARAARRRRWSSQERSEALVALDPEISTRLEAAGLAVEEKVGYYRLRYRLYERLRL